MTLPPLRPGLKSILSRHPADIVLLSSLRTPISRAHKGALSTSYPEQLLCAVLRATLASTPTLDSTLIDDVCIGSVLQELGGAKAGRMAQLHAGFSARTPFSTVNRQCSSGLAAITAIAQGIATGAIHVGVGGGMESMSRNYGSRAIPTVLWPELRGSGVKEARDCVMPMGATSENVARRYGVTRAEMDAFAVESHGKASRAQRAGWFDQEIVPVRTRGVQPEKPSSSQPLPGLENGERNKEPNEEGEPTESEIITTVDKDDGIRHTANLESLSKLKPAFSPTGASTAGNSSQISDGAAATLLMRRSTAHDLGLAPRIIGKWVATQTVGCLPDEMGVGPAVAIPKLLAVTGVQVEEVGIWEINEAFASQALYCIRKLGISEDRVNPKGGAIALGHPLGATGARQVATLMPELERQGEEVGVVSMCIGTGMGMAAMFVRE